MSKSALSIALRTCQAANLLLETLHFQQVFFLAGFLSHLTQWFQTMDEMNFFTFTVTDPCHYAANVRNETGPFCMNIDFLGQLIVFLGL